MQRPVLLASDFIVDNELPPLLDKAEKNGTLLIPTTVSHCRFLREPNLSRYQAVNDPQCPLWALSAAEREHIFDQISQQIERHVRVNVNEFKLEHLKGLTV